MVIQIVVIQTFIHFLR